MDNKMQNQEEEHLLNDLPNEAGSFTTIFKTEAHKDAVQPNDCKVEIKTEPPDYCSENQTALFPEEHIKKDLESKIEIKEENWWLETENTDASDALMDLDTLSVKSSRSSLEENIRVTSPTTAASSRDHQQKKFTCQFCGITYKKVWWFNKHQRRHLIKDRHPCKTCGKLFKGLPYLKTHAWIHEDKKPHSCKICNKTFMWPSHLKAHNLIHEGKKPHHCNTCGKCFTRLENLKSHNLIHDGKKPYRCKVCDRRFRHVSTLNHHNLIHEGRKPHKCKLCNKKFRLKAALKHHTLIHHGN